MNAFLLCLIFGWSGDLDLNEENKYQVNYHLDNPADVWIQDKDGYLVAKLIRYEIYNNNQRLKLYSKLGFTLENIPLNNSRFYNECIEVFLEIEREMPKAYQCLKSRGQNAKEINTLRFSFPLEPRLTPSGLTQFWHPNAYTCTKDGVYKRGGMWLIGVYDPDSSLIFVTFHPRYYHILPVHEYIHACGYGHVCGENPEQEKKNFMCAERPN